MSYNIYSTTTPYTYGNITLTPTTGTNWTIGVGGANGTSATDWTNATWTTAPVTVSQQATIDLRGKDADVVINGESLKETLQAIKEALRIPGRIQQDAKLEESFEELRSIREKYEEKVKEYEEKKRVWDTLKNQDL